MGFLDVRKRFKLTWLAMLAVLPILLAACGDGVSDEEFAAVQGDLQAAQAQAQTAQARVAELQQRLDRGAAITEVVDAIFAGFGPPPEAILEFSALIQASGDPTLLAGYAEIVDAILASGGPPPQEALSQAAAKVQASGNAQVVEKFQEFLEAVARGEGGAAFVELAALIQASGDPALQAAFVEFNEASPEGEPPFELFEEFEGLIRASGNEEILEAWEQLGEPSLEFLEEVGAKLTAVEDPSLDALWETAVQSEGEEFDSFYDGLFDALKETVTQEPN